MRVELTQGEWDMVRAALQDRAHVLETAARSMAAGPQQIALQESARASLLAATLPATRTYCFPNRQRAWDFMRAVDAMAFARAGYPSLDGHNTVQVQSDATTWPAVDLAAQANSGVHSTENGK